jgi:hypothetical protein
MTKVMKRVEKHVIIYLALTPHQFGAEIWILESSSFSVIKKRIDIISHRESSKPQLG